MSEVSRRTPPVPRLELDLAARTDRGCVRSGNEDSFVAAADGAFAVLAVCDGMGGAAGGEVASATAARAIREVLVEAGDPSGPDDLGRRLLASVETASRRVFEAARASRSLAGMGTTATACALLGPHLYLAQVGDSRAYLLRRGALTQLTRDQTLATLLVEQGQLTPEDVETFEHRNIILQAVGTHARVEVDLRHLVVGRGDVLLVCSDGLHGVVDHRVMRDLLDAAPSAEAACDALIAAALEAGGPDNITCVVARVVEGPAPVGAAVAKKAILAEPVPDTEPMRLADPQVAEHDARARGVLARLASIFKRRRAAVW